jgi:hypothetical protein
MRFGSIAASALAAIALSGCATVIEGTTQDVAIATDPPGATCIVEREGKPIGTIASTPGAAHVDKNKHDLTIRCSKPGYQDGVAVNRAVDSGVAEAGEVADFVTGGVLSTVDEVDGAGHKYDGAVSITLVPVAKDALAQPATPAATTAVAPPVPLAPAGRGG